jgi:hypothetical protein
MPPPDLIDLFVTPLNSVGVRYMVTGAVAAIMYGEPRLTHDVDVVVALRKDDARKLAEQFAPTEFYVPPIEVMEAESARSRYGHFNIIHIRTTLKADVYPAGDDSLNAWGLDHRRAMETRHGTIWTAPPEYVVLLKMQYWREGGSDKHLRDIRAMLRVLGAGVDRGMIQEEAMRRGLRDQWSVASADSTVVHRGDE